MRAIWKGAISFGLVTVPVRVYSATEDHDVPLHQVHDADGGRERDGGGHADPHAAQGRPAAAQERGDDPDDERGLEAFAEADHEGCEHEEPSNGMRKDR